MTQVLFLHNHKFSKCPQSSSKHLSYSRDCLAILKKSYVEDLSANILPVADSALNSFSLEKQELKPGGTAELTASDLIWNLIILY